MSHLIDVRVNPDGTLNVEFVGFAGEDCYEEAARLEEALAALGLSLGLRSVRPKSAAEIRAELGVRETDRRIATQE